MAHAPIPGAHRQENAHISFKVADQIYSVWPGEVTDSLAREFRSRWSMSFRKAVAALVDDPDIDLIPPMAWLADRQSGETDPKVIEIRYDTEIEMVDEPVEDPDSPLPEAGTP